MSTLTYERSGRTNTGAQAVRLEGMRNLRILVQGETVLERALTAEELGRLGPLVEQARQQPAPVIVLPTPGGPKGMAVSLAFEGEEAPRVRAEAHPGQPVRGVGSPYDALLEDLDELLTEELHARSPKHAYAVLPHELRQQE
ncbi:MAG TPA: hypothetical protein VF664_03730 [Cystobacter sp.]